MDEDLQTGTSVRCGPGKAGRAILALSFAAAFSMQSCSGKIAGQDERANWLPAFTFTTYEGEPIVDRAYLGTDVSSIYGFNSFYPGIREMPEGIIGDEERLISLLLRYLSATSFDFSSVPADAALKSMSFAYMTDLSTWPNAIFSENMGSVYGFLILDSDARALSDCALGPCERPDFLALNNKSSFHTDVDDMGQLDPQQRQTAISLASSLSEEFLHSIWYRGLAQEDRMAFTSLVGGIWSASSADESGDIALSSAWMNGGIAFAISHDGSLNDYTLRNPIRNAIQASYPGMQDYEVQLAEMASISYLQLIGRFASDFAGNSSRYLDYYAGMDKRDGVPMRSYSEYRGLFISRESYPHTGALEAYRLIIPVFMRAYFEPHMRPAYLDGIFSDGISNPAISQNPYLQDAPSFVALAAEVIPRAIGLKQ